MRAVQAVLDGQHPESVAAAHGMHRKTVYGWVAKYNEGGWAALKAKPVPGRAPSLSDQQLGELYALVAGNDPRQLQFEFALWTREMVQALIQRRFGVLLSVTTVGRILEGPGHVGAKAAVARLPGRPAGRRTLEAHGIPEDRETRREAQGDDLRRRRGLGAQRLPPRHHVGAGRSDPGHLDHRGTVLW